jgi:transposase, IS5 family
LVDSGGGGVLCLVGEQVESLFDEALPIMVRELPGDLARLDVLLSDPVLLEPIAERWEASAVAFGRPTIPMSLFVRLMVVKQRSGWGYETLVREVSDSLHLRRFCGLSLTASVPHESTVRKLARRLGHEMIEEITRVLIEKAVRERRFVGRAVRVDSTVVEADVRWPSDAALALDATRRLAREGARVGALLSSHGQRVQDRSRAAGRRLRLISRTAGRRLGSSGAREQVLKLTGEAAKLVDRSIREARRLIARARASARGRGAQRKLAAAARLQRTVDLAETVTRQITKRLAGERITDRVVSLADPDARPIGKGKLGKRYEFGYVFQLAEITPNTRRGARGLLLPAASRIGSPNESELLPQTAGELSRLGIKPREVALDGGFPPDASNQAFPDSHVFIAGRQQPAARRSRKRLAGYRVGCEARISHLKRSYGLRRSRLRKHQGARTWVGWAILAYNLDTLAVQAA